MAVNPVQFLVASNASITDGSKVVNISGNVDCSRVFSGTAVFLGGADNPAEAVAGTSPDGSGNSTITLRNNWSQGDVVNQQMVTFNTNEGLAEAISNVREIVSNVSAIEDLATQGLIKRIDDNTYEIVNISAVGESLITANDASSQRSVMGLGSAATKNVGTASGNVMEVGAFGLGVSGGAAVESDLNALFNTTQFFAYLFGATGSPDGQGGSGITLNKAGATFSSQLAISSDESTLHTRNYDNGSWQPWNEYYHSGNSVNPLDYGLGGLGYNLANESIDALSETTLVQGRSGTNSSATTGDNPFPALGGAFGGINIKTVNSTPNTYNQQLMIAEGTPYSQIKFRTSNATGVYSRWYELYHDGNTNFNEFFSTGSQDIIAFGYAFSPTGCVFSLPINSFSLPTSVTTTGAEGFEIADRTTQTLLHSNILSFTLTARVSTRFCFVEVTGLSGFTTGQDLVLRSRVGSKFTVNF